MSRIQDRKGALDYVCVLVFRSYVCWGFGRHKRCTKACTLALHSSRRAQQLHTNACGRESNELDHSMFDSKWNTWGYPISPIADVHSMYYHLTVNL